MHGPQIRGKRGWVRTQFTLSNDINALLPRFSLNFKGIPYKTEWVEYPDIKPLSIKLGIESTSWKADGSPQYTLPAIYDPTTGVYISDSLKIAQYLEKTYPDTPALFPNGTLALQIAFTDAFASKSISIWSSIVAATYFKLNPRSQEYFRRTREEMTGKKMEELAPTGEAHVRQWADFEKGFGRVDEWYSKNDDKGPFLLGDKISWADFVVASYLMRYKVIWGEESSEWKTISSWHDGRWASLLESLKKYHIVV